MRLTQAISEHVLGVFCVCEMVVCIYVWEDVNSVFQVTVAAISQEV